MPMPPKQPTEPATTPITGWCSRSSTMAAWISAMAARPRLASCRRTPPVSSSSTARVGMPLRLSSAASSRLPAIFAPPTSPMLPPWKAPSMAAITAGWPSMVPLATTTPSSAWVTMPCFGSQGEVTRSNGSSSSRKLPASSSAQARSRAPSSTKLRDCSRRVTLFAEASVMADLLQSLFQAQAHHAGGRAEVVDVDVQRR